MKNLGFCINRADILDSKGAYYKLNLDQPLGIECVGNLVDQ
jgi:hypothetical protein